MRALPLTFTAIVVAAAAAGAMAAGCRPAGASDDRGVSTGSAVTAAAPAGVDPAELRFDRIALPTGVTLRYAERGDPQGRAVILLHGYSDSWFSFSRILPLLPETLHVFALDQRGHGESDQPASGYAMTDLAADVVAFMDAKQLRSAVIVGHSMGTLVAQQTALRAPGRIDGLLLIAGGADVSRLPGLDEFIAMINGLEDPVPAEFVRGFQESTVHQPVPPEFMNEVVQESSRLTARVWKGLLEGMLATAPATELAARGIPTLLVWGARDAYFQRDAQDALLEMLPGAELRVYEETGHAPHWERPERTARDVQEFVAGL